MKHHPFTTIYAILYPSSAQSPSVHRKCLQQSFSGSCFIAGSEKEEFTCISDSPAFSRCVSFIRSHLSPVLAIFAHSPEFYEFVHIRQTYSSHPPLSPVFIPFLIILSTSHDLLLDRVHVFQTATEDVVRLLWLEEIGDFNQKVSWPLASLSGSNQ